MIRIGIIEILYIQRNLRISILFVIAIQEGYNVLDTWNLLSWLLRHFPILSCITY